MSLVWTTADWHLGHANCAKWRGFDSVHHHNQTIMSNYAELVGKNDVVWFLGDIILTADVVPQFNSLPGRKRLVLGNHDTDHFQKRTGLSILDFASLFEQIHGLYKYKDAWLSHAPIHPQQLRGRLNIHGHMHASKLDDNSYINVSLEQTDMKPVKYQEILRRCSGI